MCHYERRFKNSLKTYMKRRRENRSDLHKAVTFGWFGVSCHHAKMLALLTCCAKGEIAKLRALSNGDSIEPIIAAIEFATN